MAPPSDRPDYAASLQSVQTSRLAAKSFALLQKRGDFCADPSADTAHTAKSDEL